LDDLNGDACTIFSSGFCLGRGFTIGCSKQEVPVAKAVCHG
jgi:uncharacterized protein